MIQDIGSKKLNNHYDPTAVPDDTSLIFFIKKGACAVSGEEPALVLPTYGECSRSFSYTYLFSIDKETFFLADDDCPVPNGFRFVPIKSLRNDSLQPKHYIFAAFTALHLSHWYAANRFCGTCGTRTVHDSVERARRCPSCGSVIYPKLLPAVIVAVTNGDRILLTKYNRPGNTPNYALIAGIGEIGETLEQCVAREVMEESGLRVKNIRYYKSQPWGIVDDILAGFYCDVDGDDEIRLDRTELKEGAWFRREEVVLQTTDFSLTNEMMKRFKEGKENEPLS